jgi:hypothetical protein
MHYGLSKDAKRRWKDRDEILCVFPSDSSRFEAKEVQRQRAGDKTIGQDWSVIRQINTFYDVFSDRGKGRTVYFDSKRNSLHGYFSTNQGEAIITTGFLSASSIFFE